MSSSWSDDLPDDILLLIVKKVIGGSDFKSFSQVCSSWRSIAEQDRKRFRHVLPRIFTKPYQEEPENNSAFRSCPFPSKLKRWPPELRLPENSVVCGSREGWIVVMMKDCPHQELTLVNPETQVRFELPYTSSVSRIIFSANPTDHNCYVIAVPSRGTLRCCKLGDVGWTVVIISGEKNPSSGFVDAIYSRGKLCALRKTGELFVCDDITGSPPIITEMVNSQRCSELAMWRRKRWPELFLPKNYVVCGSHQGWIVMRNHDELTLINPVTQVRFELPFTSTASRIIFSANPMDYNCYCIIADRRGPLTCCKLGDMECTVIESSGKNNAIFGFVDAIYYRGKLYALHATGYLFVCDDITGSPPMMTKLEVPILILLHRSPARFFLVESGQELLLVYRKGTYLLAEGLEVYRLDIGGLRWDRVTNLGEHALFLGKSQPFSLSESDVRGIKGNHIYYIEEGSFFVSVFSLENSMAEVEFLTTQKFPWDKSLGVWFMPQLFS